MDGTVGQMGVGTLIQDDDRAARKNEMRAIKMFDSNSREHKYTCCIAGYINSSVLHVCAQPHLGHHPVHPR